MIMKKILAAGWSVLTLLGVYLMMFTEFVSLGDYLGFQLVSDFINAGVAMGLYSDHPEFILLYMTLILVFVVLWIISLVKLKTTHFFEKLVVGDAIISLAHFLLLSGINGWFDWRALLIRGLKTALVLAFWILIKRKAGTHSACEQ